MKHVKQYLAVALILITLLSCSNSDDSISGNGYVKTVIPTDVNTLFEAKGTATKDTVIVYAHGGPVSSLISADFEEPQFNNYYRVYVKQAQHINATIEQNEITFDQAKQECGISTDMYQNVLEHFVNQGKTVIAMSHSYGSFILPNVLATKPNIANKYIIMAGRLDMPEIVWQGFRDGNTYSFTNGDTPVADGGSSASGGDLSFTRLQAGLGHNRFTQLLANKDLTNISYIYGELDVAVGKLSQEEKQFLTDKNANSFGIIDGDHSAMFLPDGLDYILNNIIRSNNAVFKINSTNNQLNI